MAVAPEVVRPAFVSMPEFTHTLGPEVGAVAALAGFAPDPEQQMLLDAAFAFDPRTGKSVAFEVVVIAPRQNLKTGFLKQTALGHLFVTDESLVPWTAHEFTTAQEASTDLEALIDGAPELRSRVRLTTRGEVAKHGTLPEIRTRTGGRMIFKTRTSGGGRGLSGRKLYLDEGYAVQPGQVGAVTPIMLAQPDPQLFVGSSACRPESAYLWSLVKRGRASAAEQLAGRPGERRLVYVEFCAPPPAEVCDLGTGCDHERGRAGCGCDKREVIVLFHSAITRGRIQFQTVVDLRTMPATEYAREIMGWHDVPVDAGGLPVLVPDHWRECLDEASEATGPAVFSLDVAPMGDSAAIVAAGWRDDRLPHVEVTSSGGGALVDHRPGRDWVLPRLADLRTRHSDMRVAVMAGGAAAAMRPDIEALGVEVVEFSQTETATACEFTRGRIAAQGLRHVGQQALSDAALSARKRDVGRAGAWLWMRFDRDLTPLYAMTLALWLLVGGGEVAIFGGGDLDTCDRCGERPHDDPDGVHDFLCETCRDDEEVQR